MDILIKKSKVQGKIFIDGAKNETLPILAATILTFENIILENVPNIEDISEKLELMKDLGCEIECLSYSKYQINTKNIKSIYEKSTRIRTILLLLGPLLAKFKYVKLPYPAGDKIGIRKINLHEDFLREMGAEIIYEENYIIAKCSQLKAINFNFPMISVGASQHAIITACLCEGISILSNISIEPETVNLCKFIENLGYQIDGIGSSRLVIYGKSNNTIKSNIFKISSDRLQAVTYLLMALVTHGEIEISGHNLIENCSNIFSYLVNLGLDINLSDNKIIGKSSDIISNFCSIITGPYPEFNTDYQPLFAAACCLRSKKSSIKDTIFANRFQYVNGLMKIGASIDSFENYIEINKINNFSSDNDTILNINDIRCGASYLIAALNTDQTILRNFYHISRGYSNIFSNFNKLNIQYEIYYEKSLQ